MTLVAERDIGVGITLRMTLGVTLGMTLGVTLSATLRVTLEKRDIGDRAILSHDDDITIGPSLLLQQLGTAFGQKLKP